MKKFKYIILTFLLILAYIGNAQQVRYKMNSTTNKLDMILSDSYVKSLASSGLPGASSYLDPVKSFSDYPIPTDGERYISNVTNNVIEYDIDSTKYDSTIVVLGNAALVSDSSKWYLFTTTWVEQSTPSVWATSGDKLFNTNSGIVLINRSTWTGSTSYKLAVQGSIYSSNLITSGNVYLYGGSSTRGLARNSASFGKFSFNDFTANSYSLDMYSGSTLGGRFRWYTKNTLAMSIDSNQNVIIGDTTAGTHYKLPKVDGSDSQYLQTDGAGNTLWASIAGGGTFSKASWVSDSLNILNAGSDITGDGTFSNPYATLNYAESQSNNKGDVTIYVMGGNYYPTSNLGTVDSLKWVYYNSNVYTTSNADVYVYNYTTGATNIDIRGTANFYASGAKGVFYSSLATVNCVFNYNDIYNSGSATSVSLSGLYCTSKFNYNSNSGTGSNIVITGSSQEVIIDGFVYNTGTGYCVYSIAGANNVTLNGFVKKTTSQNAVYFTSSVNLTVNCNISATASLVLSSASARLTVNSQYITGNVTISGTGTFNARFAGAIALSSAAKYNFMNELSGTITCDATSTANVYGHMATGLLTKNTNAGTINYYMPYANIAGSFQTYGNVNVFGDITCLRVYLSSGTLNIAPNANITTGTGGTAPASITMSASTTLILNGSKIDGGADENILLTGNAKIISNGGRLLHATKSIECGAFTLSYVGYDHLRCKAATNGTITDIITINNKSISVDAATE